MEKVGSRRIDWETGKGRSVILVIRKYRINNGDNYVKT